MHLSGYPGMELAPEFVGPIGRIRFFLRPFFKEPANTVSINGGRGGVDDGDRFGRGRIEDRDRPGQVRAVGPEPVTIAELDRSDRRQMEATVDPGYSPTNHLGIGNIASDETGIRAQSSKRSRR
jgi:hypothetical protein